MKQEITIKSGNNLLRGFLELPDYELTGRIPIAILLHGLCEDRKAEPIESLASYFIRHNMAVLRMDFQAHGESEGIQEEMTIPGEVEDAYQMLLFAKNLSFISKVIVIGHSQGGVVASLLAGQHPEEIDGVILLAPAAILEECATKGDFGVVHYDPNDIPESIRMKGWDYKLGREYLRTAKELKIYETSKNYKGKVLLIQGEKDSFIPMKYAIQYERIYKDCRLAFIPDCNHMFRRKNQEMLDLVDNFVYYHVLR